MELSAPTNLQDVLSDGLFLTAAQDLAFSASFGQISTVEFNFHAPKTSPQPVAESSAALPQEAVPETAPESEPEAAPQSEPEAAPETPAESSPTPPAAAVPVSPAEANPETKPATRPATEPATRPDTTSEKYAEDLDVDVRITSSTGVHDFKGTRIAVIENKEWTWATSSAARLNVAELKGTHPYSAAMVQAARTVNAGRPVFIAQQKDHLCAVVINLYSTSVPWPEVVARGLEQSDPGIDEKRALTALAVAMNYEEMPAVGFSGNRITSFPGHRGAGSTTLAHVVTDGFYTTVEQRLFYSGRFPQARLQLNWTESMGILSTARGNLPVQAHIVATVTNGVFTWAWADPKLAANPMAAAAHNLKKFGADCGIPELLRPHSSAQQAFDHHFIQAAMRILNVWTLETVHLNEHIQALVLINSPELTLPPLTAAVRAAVLRVALPEMVDRKAALNSYEQVRGIPLS